MFDRDVKRCKKIDSENIGLDRISVDVVTKKSAIGSAAKKTTSVDPYNLNMYTHWYSKSYFARVFVGNVSFRVILVFVVRCANFIAYHT